MSSPSTALLRLADPATHTRQTLSNAATALTRGDAEAAFFMADRICKLPLRRRTGPLVLRAEALSRMGMRDAAVADIQAAFEVDPHDGETLNRRLLWSSDDDAIDAARRIVLRPDPSPIVARALSTLPNDIAAVASARVIDGRLHGWIAWRRGDNITIEIDCNDLVAFKPFAIDADPEHPLSGSLGRAAQFSFDTSSAYALWSGVAAHEGRLRIKPSLGSIRSDVPKADDLQRQSRAAFAEAPRRSEMLTVVVPVFFDFETTQMCFDSLANGVAGSRDYRVVVIDDASPDPQITALLARSPFRVLTNLVNLGFAKSVNRALAAFPEGDVVLLNADAVMPPGALDRLADAAYSAADIGTVTPLSNNGELTSIPRPYEANPMPTRDASRALDAAAQRTGLPKVIDLPSGIGFCLYIRHDCRVAISQLSEDYDRGYGEDVDLCLRARDAGFRNVCATDVVVAHAGSRSFRSEKRALVVRNLRRMEHHFPTHRAEVAAFRLADPLEPARLAIAQALRPKSPATIIVATPATKASAEARCADLAETGEAMLIVVDARQARSWRCAAGGAFVAIGKAQDIAVLLADTSVSRIEICDPVLFDDFVRSLPDAPCDLYVCGRSPTSHDQQADLCWAERERRIWEPAWSAAHRRIAADDAAAAFCSRILGASPDELPTRSDTALSAVPSAGATDASGRLAVIALANSPLTPQFLTMLARIIRADALRAESTAAPWPIVVLGSTLWDEVLMASGLVHVTGAVNAGDLADDIARYRISGLWIGTVTPTFGDPLQRAARKLQIPIAGTYWATPADQKSADAATPGLRGYALAQKLASWHEKNAQRHNDSAPNAPL